MDSEYQLCMQIDLGKTYKERQESWKQVNNPLGTEYHQIHQRWGCNYECDEKG